MTERQYEPGTVAAITLKNGALYGRALRTSDRGWRVPTLGDFYYDREVADVRPLVVLNLEDQPGVLATLYDSLGFMYAGQPNALRLQDLIRQIETQTKPTKPAEIGTMDEFHADGRQYLVPTRASAKFLEADSAIKRLQVAELVVEDGRVVKNRRGARTDD